MFKKLIALPYELARLPLTVADRQLAARLPETSLPRLTLDRTLGSADRVAGAVLRNPGLAARGSERLDRAATLGTAARLEHEAEARREQARATAAAGREEAAAQRQAAQDHAESGLDEAATTEARGKQRAKATARKAAATRKAVADERAETLEAAAEQRQKRAATAARTKKQAAQKGAKQELAEARRNKEHADAARADAERLEDLAEAKKRKRRQD